MTGKTKIAISACLLGQMVRYDGKDKKQPLIIDFFFKKFSDNLEIIPFCPEVAIGLGVPRAKIQAVKLKKQQIRILGVENHTYDVTEPLKLYACTFLQQHPDIRFFIVKSKSPSCGYQSTPLFISKEVSRNGTGSDSRYSIGKEGLTQIDESYEQISLTSGMFVQTVLELKPEIYIIDESRLTTEQACLSFLQQVAEV